MAHSMSRDSITSIYFEARGYILSSSDSLSEMSDDDDDDDDEDEDDDDAVSLSSLLDAEPRMPQSVGGSVSEYERASEARSHSHLFNMGHRSVLPSPAPDISDVSIWSLLRKNIGKDLSRTSMPVVLNEPLSSLQKVCEELEYSELIDQAVLMDNPYDRMVQVAAFAVSAYSSMYYRAQRKPFNPLLGETYECIRPDKGWKFVAEQVSHHPPVTACHCHSANFVFWQDVRIKNKFWGKSMEIQPMGTIHLQLPKYGDEYEWKKVTSSVHNLLSSSCWLDLYGDITITNTNNNISCQLTFVKSKSWSGNRCEVHGKVYNAEGEEIRHLFGKWNESIYCGVPPEAKVIWRSGAMPENFEDFYGFTRFAIELNELLPDQARQLPKSDTRYRPDQRLLEEGNVKLAEQEKQRLEHIQRERRKEREKRNQVYEPSFFRPTSDDNDNDNSWLFKNSYWDDRAANFTTIELPHLW